MKKKIKTKFYGLNEVVDRLNKKNHCNSFNSFDVIQFVINDYISGRIGIYARLVSLASVEAFRHPDESDVNPNHIPSNFISFAGYIPITKKYLELLFEKKDIVIEEFDRFSFGLDVSRHFCEPFRPEVTFSPFFYYKYIFLGENKPKISVSQGFEELFVFRDDVAFLLRQLDSPSDIHSKIIHRPPEGISSKNKKKVEMEIDNYKEAAAYYLATDIWKTYPKIMIKDVLQYSGFKLLHKFHYEEGLVKNNYVPDTVREWINKAAPKDMRAGGNPAQKQPLSKEQFNLLDNNSETRALSERLEKSIASYFIGYDIIKNSLNQDEIEAIESIDLKSQCEEMYPGKFK